jgi:hypothetical protein
MFCFGQKLMLQAFSYQKLHSLIIISDLLVLRLSDQIRHNTGLPAFQQLASFTQTLHNSNLLRRVVVFDRTLQSSDFSEVRVQL